ncbi:Conserved hypothetical protein [Candidatus Protochlamydia naegleriophila]|uniref:Uncharacterized protein n=1 Tax=Candidatus Protochlamydia naegleriophila TaxID=389348 RepID=A0A0U5JGI5_9BACT|nr:hypothetical protein [Candidatus Protochlamydia naegleriophila]CUI17994.1 Conserved hypothetical protein [Candidatus Protochlamydia naegleriophila]
MIIPSLSSQETAAVQDDLGYFGIRVASDHAVHFIAMIVGGYAQNFFNDFSEQEQLLLKAFLVDEWDALQQWNSRYPLQNYKKKDSESKRKEWIQLYPCYNLTLEKGEALKAFIQTSQICGIFPDNFCKDVSGGIRPAHLMTITPTLKKTVGITQERFFFLASIQSSKSVTIMAISEKSWNLLNNWLEESKRRPLMTEGRCCIIA